MGRKRHAQALACSIAVLLTGSARPPAALAAGQAPLPKLPATLSGRPLPNSQFGWSVAIAGATAVAGAPSARGGRVYTYLRSGRAWRPEATLGDPGDQVADSFGWSLAVSQPASGPILAVGAPGAGDGGVAYIYVRFGGGWRRQATLADPLKNLNDLFGSAVAVSGPTAIIGDQLANNGAGAAYIYVRSGNRWHQQAKLTNPGRTSADNFASAVAIAGNTAVVGAPAANGSRGAAYIYARRGSRWHEQAKRIDPDHLAYDLFGAAVAVSATMVVVGAQHDVRSHGAAYIYVLSGSTWRRQGTLADSRHSQLDLFGTAVAASGSGGRARVVVGQPSGNPACGAAYDFARTTAGTWREHARIVNPGCAPGDVFGDAVALSGRTALIGAPGKNNSRGAVYVLSIP